MLICLILCLYAIREVLLILKLLLVCYLGQFCHFLNAAAQRDCLKSLTYIDIFWHLISAFNQLNAF